MTKINKPPTTSNPNIKLKKPNSKEEEDFMQPVKKTVIAKNIKIVKKPEDINASPRKSENESADKAKTGVSSTDPKAKSGTTDNKGKSGTDSNSQKNAAGSGGAQVGYFSWLWRYFPKKKT